MVEKFLFLIIKPYLSKQQPSVHLQRWKVSGEKIDLTNGSAGQYNYNAGTIELENLNISTPGCTFYNCGTVKVDKLNINNRGTKFVNQGKTEIEETYTQTTIENGCFLTVENLRVYL